MRALVISISVMFVASSALSADGPIEKGSVMLGGSMYFQTQGDEAYESWDGDSYSSLSFAPEISAFVVPGLAIGPKFELTHASQGSCSATEISLGPRLAYYFALNPGQISLRGSAIPYLATFFSLGSRSFGGCGSSITVLKFGGEGGALFMVSDWAGVDFGVRFTRERYSNDYNAVMGTTINAGLGLKAFVF
jgi:hypothetical protein